MTYISVAMDLLDPKQDIVFKMLFARPGNEALLISLIEAVIRPRSPIVSVAVLNPALVREQVDDRGIVLDVLVRLADGTRVNLEMQCDPRGAILERWLYHWARLYCGGIQRGDEYEKLTPVVCIVFVDARIGTRFHELHRLVEVHAHCVSSEHLALHVIALPRLGENTDDESEGLLRWARFFRARSDGELQSIADEDAIMTQAKTALEELSQDDLARQLAEDRRRAEVIRGLERERDLEEGEARGFEKGVERTLRETIAELAEDYGLELTEARKAQVASASLLELEAIKRHVRTHRRWP